MAASTRLEASEAARPLPAPSKGTMRPQGCLSAGGLLVGTLPLLSRLAWGCWLGSHTEVSATTSHLGTSSADAAGGWSFIANPHFWLAHSYRTSKEPASPRAASLLQAHSGKRKECEASSMPRWAKVFTRNLLSRPFGSFPSIAVLSDPGSRGRCFL